MLHTVPLQSLLDWLSKPKGPNLGEASVAAAPEKALVLAVTKTSSGSGPHVPATLFPQCQSVLPSCS